ncbi:MAG: hypothetical protein WCP21_18180 [Armatimonadota bacterium]
MEDLGASFNRHCTCVQRECPLWGNCVPCIENHKRSGNHIPECMQDLVRDSVATLCRLVEFNPLDKRPSPEVFERLDRPAFIKQTLASLGQMPDGER